ncbi:MAG: hypothetical protein KGL39_10645 [Patescibacteria group bacterium]|nr:hypothetical protein [Patescibacteria group bacterium]
MHAKLDTILCELQSLTLKGATMSQELDTLAAQVAASVTVEQSAITLLNGLSNQITALAASGGTPAQFTALATQLKTSADALSAAIVANTPSAPTATPATAPQASPAKAGA